MSSNVAEFVQTLTALLSGDNALRGAAEQRYDLLKQEQPQLLMEMLFQALLETQIDGPVREQAAVLLRQLLSASKTGVDIQLLSKLLILFESEAADKVRKKVADCISGVGHRIVVIDSCQRPNNAPQWPDLLPTLVRIIMDISKSACLRADALRTVNELARSIWPVMVASMQQTQHVIRSCLADAAVAVRAEAASLLCGLVAFIPDTADRKPLQPLLPEVFGIISQLADSNEAEKLKIVLQAIILVNEDCVEFFKDFLSSHLLPIMCTLAMSHTDTDVRSRALEVLCSAAEGKPKMMLKVPECLERIFNLCAVFSTALDDDVEGWASQETNEKSDNEELPDIGAEVVDRICKKLHDIDCFSKALAVLAPATMQLFQQQTWKPVVAGLKILRQIIEYVDESVLDQMLEAVRVKLHDPHPRIRNAAWGCVMEFAVQQEDAAASDEWAAKLLPDFLTGLDDSCARNVLQCMEAFHHYGEHVDREILIPFAQPFMEKLGVMLQGNRLVISREAITFIAVIAQQIQDSFAQYYPHLMPLLKTLIAQTIHKVEERELLGKTFECVSLLANTVSRDTFRPDAEVILESMIRATQQPDLPHDDPVKEYTMAAAERICCTLRDEFLPFVPHFLPLIFSKLKLTPTEYDSSSLSNGSIDTDTCSMTVVPSDNGDAKILVMSSSELEDLQNALDCVRTFVEKLGPKYIPYVKDTAIALLPVFEFSMKEEVRDAAFETWGQLCHAAHQAGQRQIVADLFKEFMNRIMPKLEMPVLDVEGATVMANGVKSCLAEAGPDHLTAEQVRHITTVCLKVVDSSFSRTRQIKGSPGTGAAREGADDEDDAETDDGDEKGGEMLLRQAVNNICTAMMTHHPDLFVAEGLPLYMPAVQQLLQPGPFLDDNLVCCLYVLASWGEHLGHRVVPHWPSFLPQLLQHVANKAANLRMAACYACSFFAREAAFAPFACEAAAKLAEIITQTRARSKKKSEKDNQMAADNALSALLEILVHHEAALEAMKSQLWGAWVAGLPCQEDADEGKRNHGTLVQLVEKQKAEVIGPNGSQIPRVLSVLVDVYKTEMVDDVANWCIGKLFMKVGQAQLEQYSTSFSDKQKKKVVRALQDATRSAKLGSAVIS